MEEHEHVEILVVFLPVGSDLRGVLVALWAQEMQT
jgi:hypothetical protein